jgi:hypothetical protein
MAMNTSFIKKTGFIGLALVLLFAAVATWALASGSVLWHDEIHIADGSYIPGLVEAAAGRVVMVGSEVTDSGDQDIRIRTYSTTGSLLWDTTYDRAGGYEFAVDLIVTPKDVLVVGGAQATATANVDALVLRYDAKTGNLIWSSFWDGGVGEDDLLGAALSGNHIAVVGQTETSSASFDVLVQTYNLKDGSLLWSDTYDAANKWDNANDVAIAAGVVVSVGQSTGSDGYYDLFVAGHDLNSGGLKWLTTYDPGYSARGLASVADGSTVYVVGDETASSTSSADVMVRAYDSKTGALIWGDSRDYGYGFYDSAYDVDVGGGMVVATGEGRPSSGSPDLWTLAYDALTGNLIWTSQYDVAGSVDQARAIEIAGPAAVIAGGGYDDDHEWVVQAYDLATGAISWQDIYDRSGGSDAAYGLTSLGNSVYVVGFSQEAGTGSPGTHADGTIRSYQR